MHSTVESMQFQASTYTLQPGISRFRFSNAAWFNPEPTHKESTMERISSKPVAEYVAATNAFDGKAMMATFTDDAIVNDVQREFVGRTAIEAWAEKEILGVKLTLAPTKARVHYGDEIVTFKVDGQFEKAGLPNPLLLTYYFSLRDGKICRLIILRNKTA
jgi:hypothetical protein